jgi:hypothetical protein
MKTLVKIILILVGLGVLLLIVGTVALRIYLPPEKAKALVLHHLSTQLKREVTLGSASVGILSGLHMTDLKISESPDFSKGTFLSSEQFSLKIALVPLLFRKIVVRQIILIQPEVAIVRQADGKTFNFSDLTQSTVPTQPGTSASGYESKESMPFLLLVSRAEIHKGALHFIDRSPARQSMEIMPFDLTLKNVSLTSPFSIQTSLHLKSKGDDIALSLAGQADLLKGTFTLKQGTVMSRQTKVIITGELDHLTTPEPAADLKINLAQLNLSDINAFVALPEGIKVDKPLKGVISVQGDQRAIEIRSQLVLGSLRLDGHGRVQDVSADKPFIAYHLETNEFPITEVFAYAPTMVPQGVTMKGNTQLAADISGTSSAIQFAIKWVGTDLAVAQGDTFSKAAGVPLDLSMNGDVTSMAPLKVVVKSMILHLATSQLSGSATYEVHGAQSTLQTSGELSAPSVKLDQYEGQNLQVQWALSDVTPDLSRVNGTASLNQGAGKILNVQKLAASSAIGKIALGPLDAIAKLQQKGLLNQVNLPNLQTITFDSITGTYQMHSGIMDIKTFDLNGPVLSIGDQGTVGLSGDRQMAMKVSMKLAPGTIGGTIGDLMEKDDKGRQILRFSANGPAANAKVKFELPTLDKKTVQQAGQAILKNQDVQNAVNGLLKGIFH